MDSGKCLAMFTRSPLIPPDLGFDELDTGCPKYPKFRLCQGTNPYPTESCALHFGHLRNGVCKMDSSYPSDRTSILIDGTICYTLEEVISAIEAHHPALSTTLKKAYRKAIQNNVC